MNKFTKIMAAAAVIAAVLSCAACSNKNESSAADSSSTTSSAAESAAATAEADSDASTAQAATAEAGSDTSTAQADAAASQQAPAATAEAGAEVMDVTKMYGTWALAGIDDGNGLKDVATYAADNSTDAESVMVFVQIDENGYTTATAGNEETYTYTATDYGMLVAAEGMDLGVVYDESADSIMYGVTIGDTTIKFVFMRNDAE